MADDGVRIFIDNNLALSEWHAAPAVPPTYTFDVNMTSGQHEIRVEYYEGTGTASIQFKVEAAP